MGQRTKTLLVLHCLQVELKGVRISNDVEFVVFHASWTELYMH